MKKIFNEKQRLDEILGVIQDEQAWREGDEDTPFEFGEEDELDLDIDDIDTPDEAEYAKLICPESVTLCQGLAQVFMDMKISEFFGEDSEEYEAYLKDNPEVCDKLEADIRRNAYKLMSSQARAAARAAGRAVDISAEDFEDADS